MENPYLTKEYLMIEAEESIHRLKLAFKGNYNPEEIMDAITKIQFIKMDLLHTPSVCGHDGYRGMPHEMPHGLEELKLITLKHIADEPDSLIG